MKAVMKKERAPGAELVEVDIPEPGPKDVLLKVKVAAICGTDIHINDWTPFARARITPPMIFGHETCGEVVKVGDQVTNFVAGDLVALLVSAAIWAHYSKLEEITKGDARIIGAAVDIGAAAGFEILYVAEGFPS